MFNRTEYLDHLKELFKYNATMFLLFFAYLALVIALSFILDDESALFVGIPLAFIYGASALLIKRIRTAFTITWGLLSLTLGLIWTYLLFN